MAASSRSPQSLAEWSRAYMPAYFPIGPSAFHRWLVGELTTLHDRRGTRMNVLAPRGAAKSTWSSFAYPLYCAVHGIEPYIVLTSDTGAQAKLYMDSIRSELETNELLQRDYPDVVGAGSTWREDRIRLRNGVVIEALGTGTKLRGRKNRSHRPSLVVVDDPQNTEHILSPLQRERSWDWMMKDVCNAGSPATNIVVLGTALHREAIVMKLRTTPGWRSKLWQSILSWPDRMDLWHEWEEIYRNYDLGDDEREAQSRGFYEQRRALMDAGAEVLWPEREPLYALMGLLTAIGRAAFGSEKQNDPVNPEACEWPAEYFDGPGFWFDEWPAQLAIKTMALDPSKGRDARRGDYSAYVMYGRDAKGVEYVEADLKRRDTARIVADGVEHVRLFRPEGFAIETNVFQELLLPEFQRAGLTQKVDLPIYGLVNTVNKEVRIRRNGPYLSQRRIRFKRRSAGTELLVQQLRDFPVADHDDGPDALEMARRLAIDLFNGRQAGQRQQRAST
ncbi:MAG: hypothetical protein K2R98_28280 [Gemmataceae bacterium]|nr:hypothetical protein [Gemmataceae bacterium]